MSVRETFENNALGRLAHDIAVAGAWWYERQAAESGIGVLVPDPEREIAGSVSPFPVRRMVALDTVPEVAESATVSAAGRYVLTAYVAGIELCWKLTGRELKRKLKSIEKLRKSGADVRTRLVLE